MPSTLLDHLRDLHDHMAWADAVWFECWRKSGFTDDEDLRQRVAHMADTEAAFLKVLLGEPVTFAEDRPLPGCDALAARTRENHGAFKAMLGDLTAEGLGRDLVIPWFPGSTCHITVDEALTQVTLHAQHHRGQLMTRLKALGGRPQNVDYIIWAWKNRPEGRWT